MIGKISRIRHGIVGVAIGATTLLAGLGVIADPDAGRSEQFDAKTVVIAREGERALRITEYVDIDFGSEDRRGYRRLIPDDFGTPTDVTAFSPDAADDLAVIPHDGYTEIRIGDPDRTWSGQHRYQLAYTLPDAHYDDFGPERELVVDLVSPPGGVYPGDARTERFEVIVTGYELSDLRCDVGALGDEGGCELVDAGDGTYRSVLEPLAENDGLTVGGTIGAFTEPLDGSRFAPPIPDRRSGPNRGLVALGFAGLGLLGALPVYRWARRAGSNEVFAGGAADAAYGSLPPPGSDVVPPPVSLVPDDEMADLATVEFVPPKGIDPWEGSVLLRERLDGDTVEAWMSGMVGREALAIEEDGSDLRLSSGPRRNDLDADDAELLSAFLRLGDPYETGKYDPEFAAAWRGVAASQRRRIASSGWWKRMPPGAGVRASATQSPIGLIAVLGFVLVWGGSALTAFLGAFASWPIAVVIGIAFPALVASFVYLVLLPARSAQGSALALRAESFRRFLHESEGHHVEWAWEHGLLREYSAWAVALGEADAWSRALERANVPAPAAAAAGPLIVHNRGSSMRDSRTSPSSSGSGGGSFGGGGGGFGGGGSGGGGGGGSSGSW